MFIVMEAWNGGPYRLLEYCISSTCTPITGIIEITLLPAEASSLTDPCRLSDPLPPCIERMGTRTVFYSLWRGSRTTGEFRIEICLLHTLIYLYLYRPRINTKQSTKIYILNVQKRVQMSFTSFYIRLCTVLAKLQTALGDQKNLRWIWHTAIIFS